MRIVWKFVLRSADGNVVDMPVGARILHVNKQDGYICIWAEVDPNAPREPRVFHIYPTGVPIIDGDEYVGTVHEPDKIQKDFFWLWHVYERKN